jgi:hypothetical protein
MRRTALAIFLLMLSATACGTGGTKGRGLDRGGSSSTDEGAATTERTVAVYASVIRRLITKDHTFGGSNPGFKEIYVMDGPVRGAGDPDSPWDALRPETPFNAAVKEGLRNQLADLPPLTFVQDRDSVVTGAEPGHVINDGVLLTLGPIVPAGDDLKVPNSLWISGVAGQWLTYVLEQGDTGWTIIGTDGPVAIS